MIAINVKLNTVDNIKKFHRIMEILPYEVDLVLGRYTIDAKSIMGIFGLDLTMPLQLKAYTKDAKEMEKLVESVEPFRYKGE